MRHYKMTRFQILIAWAICAFCVQRRAEATESPEVCIIGGGIAAASTAHFLTETPLTPKPKITIFEKTSKLGGRVSTLQLKTPESTTENVEAGASIIASSNQLMTYFTDLLNLTKKETPSRTMGLWDGKSFVVRTDKQSDLRTKVMLAARYGLSLMHMKRFVRDLTSQYSTVYPADDAPWPAQPDAKSLFSGAPELYNLSQVSFTNVVKEEFNAIFAREMVSAITRVNYGQDPSQMNGFSGSVALAGSGGGLWAVEGGNQQVIEGLIKRSEAEVLFETHVDRVTVNEEDRKRNYLLHSDASAWKCDSVVMAVPYELAQIELPDDITKRLDIGRKFQRTHSTFVQGLLNDETFGNEPPDSVLTIEGTVEPFTSIGLARPKSNAQDIPVYKIFSKKALDEKAIKRIFKDGVKTIAEYPWLAYPQFAPPEIFPSFDVEEGNGAFFYTSPIESLGSALEMSAVSGANAASLVRDRLGLTDATLQTYDKKEEL